MIACAPFETQERCASLQSKSMLYQGYDKLELHLMYVLKARIAGS